MLPIPPAESHAAGLAISQLLALQIIRRSLAGVEGAQWRGIGDAIRLAHRGMLHHQHVGLVVADEDAVRLTRHEKRLLRATAAAQTPDPALLDNLIFSLAPGRSVRIGLADAVTRLAAGLARFGHRLPAAQTLRLSTPSAR